MGNAILVVGLIAIIAVGFFVMRRLDKFLEKRYRIDEDIFNEIFPDSIILPCNASDKKIIAEKHRFSSRYPRTGILFYNLDNEHTNEIIRELTSKR